MRSQLTELRDAINRLHRTLPNGQWFVAPEELKALLTRDRIQKVIEEGNLVPDYQRQAVVDYVFTGARIIFGILVWKQWQNRLIDFVEHNTLDEKLPLDEGRARSIAETIGRSFAKELQWGFLPVKLTKEMSSYHCRFRDEEVLPFIGEEYLGEGALGQVYKVSVLTSMQTIFSQSQGTTVFMARKKLCSPEGHSTDDAEKAAAREEKCLQILNGLAHPNIIQLLGSYHHRESHYLLLPLLQMDLGRFLQLEPEKRMSGLKKDFQIYKALADLASAMEKVHSISLNGENHDAELARIGYHHDIRPANILVDSKTFYLADFGLGNMKNSELGSQTKWKAGLGDYVAPECMDGNFLPQEVGRPLDIWSFGCMLFEITAYMQDGPSGLKDYREQRFGPGLRANMRNRYFFTGQRLRPSVTAWFQKFIAKHRSLQKLATTLLQIDPTARPKATEVYQNLLFLSIKTMYSATWRAFECYISSLIKEPYEATITATKLEGQRLSAWGEALQLELEDPTDNVVQTVYVNGNQFYCILSELLDSLEAETNTRELQITPVARLVSAFSIRKPIHKFFEQNINKLCEPLPDFLRETLNHIMEAGAIATEDGHELQELEFGIPPQFSELSALAATKRLQQAQDLPHTRASSAGTPEEHSASMGARQAQTHKFTQLELEQSLLLESNSLRLENSEADYQLGSYNGIRVLLEEVCLVGSEDRKRQRVQLLAEMLHRKPKPTDFHVLDCLGFLQPTASHKWAIVYICPSPGPHADLKPSNPRSLHNILQRAVKYNFPLGQRFRLAYKLVNCIRQFHIVGWLHKNISSKNIIFFDQGVDGYSPTLEDPYLVKLNESRPLEKQEWSIMQGRSNSLFRHPAYSPGSCSYQPEYDYYSIGIVLLELGSWSPLEEFVKHNPDWASDASMFRQRLIDKYVPRLSYSMGRRYADVTLACLRFEAGEQKQTALKNFFYEVVAPLGDLARSPICMYQSSPLASYRTQWL